MNGPSAGFTRRPQMSELIRSESCQSGPCSSTTALADLLLVDGNPLENIRLVEDPDKNLLIIMKDGDIYKNTLPK